MVAEFYDQFLEWAKAFGAELNGENCYQRRNIEAAAFVNGGAFFGLVQDIEGASGPYHDFSLVVFPDNEGRDWLVSLCVGTLGFKNDFDLASLPGIRRRYQKLISEHGFSKTNYQDIETSLPKDYTDKVSHLAKTLKSYSKFISACEIVNPASAEGKAKIKGFLALYADIRGWGSNQSKRTAILRALQDAQTTTSFHQDDQHVLSLLQERKYLVLQGPPGTGKTRLAKILAEQISAQVYFTQFHAETSYADFVWGIRPVLQSEQVQYEAREGVLVQAIKAAKANPSKPVVLIVDEINRANLSNVLGPVFYLFEYQMDQHDIEIAITDDLRLKQLPENFYVIATMNTADRSLAVVDFALRRRFAWYTLWPQPIFSGDFHKEIFDEVAGIFEQYASDEELNLQPGQGYFLAPSAAVMNERLRYEVMPLIKEYLVEGMLSQSKDAFADFFHRRIGEALFR